MNNFILFSGGFDSTLVLANKVREYSSNGLDNPNIIATSIIHNGISKNKNDREKEARRKIISKLMEKYDNIKIHQIEIIVNINTEHSHVSLNKTDNDWVVQPLIWFSSIMPWIRKDDIVTVGYNSDDCVSQFIDQLKNYFDAISKIKYIDSKIKLDLPLLFYDRPEVMNELNIKFPYLFDLCTSCESMQIEDHCDKCSKCKDMEEILIKLYIKTQDQFWRDKLNEWFKIDFTLNKL